MTGGGTQYKIHQLNLYEKQKFLYLHDFIRENRFTVTFIGVREARSEGIGAQCMY